METPNSLAIETAKGTLKQLASFWKQRERGHLFFMKPNRHKSPATLADRVELLIFLLAFSGVVG